MPMVQEFTLHVPSMMQERFFVEIEAGPRWQRWEHPLLQGDKLEFQLENPPAILGYGPEEKDFVWLPVEVGAWDIDDGSGNAPGADAHFFFIIRREGKSFKFDLDEGLRVRLEAPTTEELAALPKHCEGIEIVREGSPWQSEEWGPCPGPGLFLIDGSWYCETCKNVMQRVAPEKFTQGIVDADQERS